MDMFQQFETDPKLEQEGVVHDYGTFRIGIARAGGANKAFPKELERATRQYRRAIQTDSLDQEIADGIMHRTYARTVIKSWEVKRGESWVEGIPQKGSEELLSVTEENIVATFKRLPDLFADIREQAGKASLYLATLREEAAGNS